MDCLRCGKPTVDKALCPECFQQGRSAQPLPPETRNFLGEFVRNEPRLCLAFTIFAIFVLYSVYARYLRPAPPLPAVALASTEGSATSSSDPCAGRQRCLIVFLAPWCPHCIGSVPMVQDIRKYLAGSGTAGIKIIVGGDAQERLNDLAGKITGLVFFDSERQFQRKMGFSAVPHWFLVNDKKLVTQRFTGYQYQSGSWDEQVRSFFTSNLAASDARYFVKN